TSSRLDRWLARRSRARRGLQSPARSAAVAHTSSSPRRSSRHDAAALSLRGRSCLRRELPLFEHEAGHEADEEEAELRVLVVELQGLLARDRREVTRLVADRGQGANALRREQPYLAEHLPGADALVDLAEDDAPLLDQVEPIRRFPLLEQHAPRRT